MRLCIACCHRCVFGWARCVYKNTCPHASAITETSEVRIHQTSENGVCVCAVCACVTMDVCSILMWVQYVNINAMCVAIFTGIPGIPERFGWVYYVPMGYVPIFFHITREYWNPWLPVRVEYLDENVLYTIMSSSGILAVVLEVIDPAPNACLLFVPLQALLTYMILSDLALRINAEMRANRAERTANRAERTAHDTELIAHDTEMIANDTAPTVLAGFEWIVNEPELIEPADAALLLQQIYHVRELFPSMNERRHCPNRRFTAYTSNQRSA